MMKLTRRTILAAGGAAAVLAGTRGAMAADLPRNIRMVIGSNSTGGDTYQTASILADALSAELKVNIKVDAVGPSEAFKALERDSRGTTIMMHHDQSYLQYLYGVPNSPNPFDGFLIGPTISINPANAYLVPKNSPYQTMADVLKAAEDGTRVRVAIQPGGTSELGFTAMKNAVRMKKPGAEANLVAVNTGSQSDKNQALFDGLADVINGSIQANEQFTELDASDQKSMRFIWLTSKKATLEQAPEAGIGKTTRDDLLKYAEPQTAVPLDDSRTFTFDKEFFLIYNDKMAAKAMDAIDAGMKSLYDKGEIQKRQTQAFFIPDYMPRAQADVELKKKFDDYAKIIKTLQGA